MNISPRAVVDTTCIGPGTVIDDFAIVRAGARIGSNCRIHPFVIIESGVEIGDGVEVFPGAFLGKEPKGAGATARAISFERSVRIGSGCSIGPHAVIFFDVHIGDNTLLGDGASVREGCRIGSRCIISRYVTINYATTIGDRVKIMDLTHITGNMVVEDGVFISTMVGSANDNAIGRAGYEDGRVVGPFVSKDAVVGAGATLLPSVRVGVAATVAAGAVVSRDVPDGGVVAGVPARPMVRK